MSWINVTCVSLAILALHLDTIGAADRKSTGHQSAADVHYSVQPSPRQRSGAFMQHKDLHAKRDLRRGGRIAIPTRTTKRATTLKVISLSTRATTQQVTVPTGPPPCNPCNGANCPSGQGYPNCGECELGGGNWPSADRSTCWW
ncbi:hypothetical protein RvY_11008 [Ramazzottius varieornatus]|uniref:Uncharacterized protein n=1 Tax=Ramazzottius varieornatus TaxID=947166 RepID=A0A1D1VH51_RAMVA|nr:hypothetical protein RvY_11008 [Ramazzottius varieornatus]